ncbi:MAG: aspartyl/asparaginyl beta-hydroxylase domain-containing protein [Roseivirga sp.]|nr:aspartyl/asparaginyl beta-hydroxylase domain-containing protein [Roseivirga sp.]
MNLKQPFFKLPFSREIMEAAQEVGRSLCESDWIAHASGFEGNSYIPILSYLGTINNVKRAPVKPTLFAEKLPAVTGLLKSFNFPIGISRLMRLEAGCDVPVHSDTNEYWDRRVRIHIPLISSDKVFFACNKEEVVMAPGEVWTFDNWRRHGVRNEGKENRIHLVFDTEAANIFDDHGNLKTGLNMTTASEELTLENDPTPVIKSGADLEETLNLLVKELDLCEDSVEANAWLKLIRSYQDEWKAIEAKFGASAQAVAYYQKAINTARQEADKLGDSLRFKVNNVRVISVFKARVANSMNLQILFGNEG